MAAPQDFLNQLRIASPCPADWAAMAGDDRSRFCGQCQKHVYDFSKMTAAEGVALIKEKEGQVCARLWRRADGTVITADCPVAARTVSKRRIMKMPLAASLVLAGALTQVGCGMKRPEIVERAKPVPVSTASDGPTPECIVGALPLAASESPFDVTLTVQGKQMSHQDWDNLPLR